MRGGEALKAYKRYAGRMAKDMKGSELQALLAEILGQEAVIQRTSGYIVWGVTPESAAGKQPRRYMLTNESPGAAMRSGVFFVRCPSPLRGVV